jgi:hypothetical protein
LPLTARRCFEASFVLGSEISNKYSNYTSACPWEAARYPGMLPWSGVDLPKAKSKAVPSGELGEGGSAPGFELDGLKDWISENLGEPPVVDASERPGGRAKPYKFVLTSIPLHRLRFFSHAFNPRTPNPGKVNELRASVEQLGLLSPLTCAFVDPSKLPDSSEHPIEPVVLIDGRHRYEGLLALKKVDKDWARRAKIDLKIYYGLDRSDLFLLATYLNKTRKALARGEYYKVLVKVYDERKRELEAGDGQPRNEWQVFHDIRSPSITNLNFDMSIGRIVGITAFDDEEDKSWFPMVGTRQQERFDPKEDDFPGFRPLTAGNMAVFLGHLCRPAPYKDDGTARSTEIQNVVRLGERFRKASILVPVPDYDTATPASVSCKHWCLDAFGSLLQESELYYPRHAEKKSILSDPDIDWAIVDRILKGYLDIMEEQARQTNRWRKTSAGTPPWSYQTQQDQVKTPLRKELVSRVAELRKRSG